MGYSSMLILFGLSSTYKITLFSLSYRRWSEWRERGRRRMEKSRISFDFLYVLYAISKNWIQGHRAGEENNQSHCALGDVTDLILVPTVVLELAGKGGPFCSTLVFHATLEYKSKAFVCFKHTSYYLTKDKCWHFSVSWLPQMAAISDSQIPWAKIAGFVN